VRYSRLIVVKKIGLHVSTGYMIARPHVTVSSSIGDDRQRARADMLQMKVGLALLDLFGGFRFGIPALNQHKRHEGHEGQRV
jgi:hypothetical protein